MDFNHTQKVLDLMDRLNAFMDEHIYPNEEAYREHFKTTDNLWKSPPLMDDLKEKAKNAGLWNLFLPESEHGAGLTNLEYAPLAEIMGRVFFASEVFNCNAPIQVIWKLLIAMVQRFKRKNGSNHFSMVKFVRAFQ